MVTVSLKSISTFSSHLYVFIFVYRIISRKMYFHHDASIQKGLQIVLLERDNAKYSFLIFSKKFERFLVSITFFGRKSLVRSTNDLFTKIIFVMFLVNIFPFPAGLCYSNISQLFLIFNAIFIDFQKSYTSAINLNLFFYYDAGYIF